MHANTVVVTTMHGRVTPLGLLRRQLLLAMSAMAAWVLACDDGFKATAAATWFGHVPTMQPATRKPGWQALCRPSGARTRSCQSSADKGC